MKPQASGWNVVASVFVAGAACPGPRLSEVRLCGLLHNTNDSRQRPLEDFLAPVFQDRLYLLRELIAQRAVDQAMIEGER
jgi:hypothetical protein